LICSRKVVGKQAILPAPNYRLFAHLEYKKGWQQGCDTANQRTTNYSTR